MVFGLGSIKCKIEAEIGWGKNKFINLIGCLGFEPSISSTNCEPEPYRLIDLIGCLGKNKFVVDVPLLVASLCTNYFLSYQLYNEPFFFNFQLFSYFRNWLG